MRSAAKTTKRKVALALAVALVVALVITGVTSGFSDPAIPSGDVAIVDGVDDGTISQDRFQSALAQNATSLGLKEPPATDDPQYPNLVDQTMQSLLQSIWVKAEAADRGVSVSSEDVDAELEKTKMANFGSDKQFQKYLDQSGLTLEQVKDQIATSLLTNALVAEVAPSQQSLPPDLKPLPPDQQVSRLADFYGVDDGDVQAFYDANIDAFKQPASRTARVILNSSQAKIAQAKKALEAGNLSDATWKKVAAKYSQDATSKDSGGQLPAPITEGGGDPLEQPVFDAPEGQLVGPTKTDRGYFLIQVTKATDASTVALDDKSKQQIEQQIITNEQARVFAEFKDDFFAKWTKRTICAPEATMQLCSNYDAPAVATTPGSPEPPAVVSTNPIAPGGATIALNYPNGYTPAQGAPQGPGAGVQLPPQPQLPAGSVPVGPDGQPVPGATGAPPTGAPPTGAPPTGAPPATP